MASKSSKRKQIGKVIRHGYNQLKQAIRPSSQSPTQNSGSAAPAPVSTGARSASAAPPATPSGLTVPHPVLPQDARVAGQSSSSTPGTNLAPIAASPTNTSPEVTTVVKLREAGSTALSGLATALRILEKSANVFPPLELAIGGFIACLDVIQAAATNSNEYTELTSELAATATTLNQYLSELGSESTNGSAARIALSIEAEVKEIQKQQDRDKTRRTVESTQDKDDIIKRYRRIEGLFRQLQGDMVLRTWRNTNKQHATALLRGMSPVDDARYNSSYSTIIKRRGCTAETREKVQADLQEWVQDPNAAKVYWMNGMAGTGKTTIAYSLCEWLETNQRLGASFFCSRGSPTCRDVHQLVPTIAYNLALYSATFRSALCKVLEEDPGASKLNVVLQFEKLVRGPMQDVGTSIPGDIVIVIDALDECEDVHGVRLVLETLLRLAANLPLKFLVTSRPEPEIRDRMLSSGGCSPSVLHLHDIEKSIVEEDIKKYLIEALSSMSSPPTDEQIEKLAKRAGNLFIYAATVVRYILPGKRSASSVARLNAVLDTDPQSTGKGQSNKKYKELDELYTTILEAAFDGEELEAGELEAMRLVLRTAVCAKEPMTALTMASLLDLTEEQVSSALQPLRSVLHVSESGGLVSTLHASFPDYMLDSFRSRDFYCDLARHSDLLAHRCFEVMEQQLRFNICSLESSFVFDGDVPDLEQRIRSCISPTLVYVCQYWGEHLQYAGPSDVLRGKLADFLTHRLLFWMEILNLKLCIVKGAKILIQAEKWLQVTGITTEAQKEVVDSRDFVTRFAAGACIRSTPHIYLSALPFCARSSSVYACYWGRTQGLVDVRGTAISRRERAAQATWMTDMGTSSLALSPDGTRIVSGSYDQTIRVWDAHSGHLVAGPFEGHTGSVLSVAFSPDGTRIASGSDDQTIRVWDAHSGNTVASPFEGHMDRVYSVAFSPNGACIVSGSGDWGIRVWDAHSGDPVAGPFEGHKGSVYSVAFSPDGTRIVSGSDDQTIQVWDAHTGNAVAGSFEGHTGSVNAVAFSPDGTRIISGSDDQTVRVWDAHTGNAIARPYEGHMDRVNSIAFSPDGTRIVSGSNDQIICVWDAHSGNPVAGPFEGHTGSVRSVAFSPDGTRIVSGSDDQTIRLWDARSSNADARPFEGHTERVKSVAFSPDGSRIVSGSDDLTIRLWDAHTGNAVFGPFKGHIGKINSVAFSPDGTRIVSGSHDQSIRVWDAHSGNPVAVSFERHTGSIRSVAFSPDGTRIVSGSDDLTIRLWDAHSGSPVAGPFEGHTGKVCSVAFSPDGARIASGSGDWSIRVWDAHSGSNITTSFPGHMGLVVSIAFSPDGTRIVSGSSDQTIRVWDTYTGNAVAGPFEGHKGWVSSVAFSPGGIRIVSCSDDRTIRVWDARTGNAIARPFEGHTGRVASVAVSPDGTRIVSGSDDRAIRVWDARTDDVAARSFEGHTNPVNFVGSAFDVIHTVSTTNHQNSFFPHVPTDQNTLQHDHIGVMVNTGDFKTNPDGWVTIDNLPFFWVSPDFHSYLPHPRNTLVIAPHGSVLIDYQQLILGAKWSECYISQ